MVAFGGVADGFVPFDVQNSDGKPSEDIITDRASSQSKSAQANGQDCKSADTQSSDDRSLPNGDEAGSQEVELQLASIVMKAVQVGHILISSVAFASDSRTRLASIVMTAFHVCHILVYSNAFA